MPSKSKGKSGSSCTSAKKSCQASTSNELDFDPISLLEKGKAKENVSKLCASLKEINISDAGSASTCFAACIAKVGIKETLTAARLAVDMGHILTYGGHGNSGVQMKGSGIPSEMTAMATILSQWKNELKSVVETIQPIVLVPPIATCPDCGSKLSEPSWHMVALYALDYVQEIPRLLLYCRRKCQLRFSPWSYDTLKNYADTEVYLNQIWVLGGGLIDSHVDLHPHHPLALCFRCGHGVQGI